MYLLDILPVPVCLYYTSHASLCWNAALLTLIPGNWKVWTKQIHYSPHQIDFEAPVQPPSLQINKDKLYHHHHHYYHSIIVIIILVGQWETLVGLIFSHLLGLFWSPQDVQEHGQPNNGRHSLHLRKGVGTQKIGRGTIFIPTLPSCNTTQRRSLQSDLEVQTSKSLTSADDKNDLFDHCCSSRHSQSFILDNIQYFFLTILRLFVHSAHLFSGCLQASSQYASVFPSFPCCRSSENLDPQNTTQGNVKPIPP